MDIKNRELQLSVLEVLDYLSLLNKKAHDCSQAFSLSLSSDIEIVEIPSTKEKRKRLCYKLSILFF